MAFITTFSAILLAGITWMTLFLAFYEAEDARLQVLDELLSPDAITGWIFFVALCVFFCWFLYRIFGVRFRERD
jgi:preprotein translocase subunit SecY